MTPTPLVGKDGVQERSTSAAEGAPILVMGAARPRTGFWRRVATAPPSIRLCLVTVVLLFLTAVFAPRLAPYNPDKTSILARNAPPSWIAGGRAGFFLGTDQLGRDVLSRCIYAMRVSVGIALVGVILGSVTGVTLGVVSGLLRGWTDRVIMTVVDFQLSVPFLLIVLVGIAIFGTDIPVLIGLVGLAYWETYARLSRGQVLSVRENPYVESAVAMGASTLRIALRHILPNIVSPVIVLLTINFPAVLLLESSLSFLGIGVQPPTASLGRMVGDGRDYMMTAWWLVISPAAFIVLLTLCVQLIGDWLRDVFDARLD